jgi:hypothetical protein
VSVFHFELRSSIHVAHAFNLTAAELETAVLGDWRRGQIVVFGDRRWQPDRTQLKIYEGRRLAGPELALGRGWANAVKRGEDVSDRLLAAPLAPPAAAVSPAVDALRREILAQCRTGRIGIHQVAWLANRWYPERRASDRLALAETAVWGLLHERRIRLRRIAGGAADAAGAPGGATDAAGEAGATGALREGADAAGALEPVAGAAAEAGATGPTGALREGTAATGALEPVAGAAGEAGAPEETVAAGEAEVAVAQADWEGILLDWRTWAGPAGADSPTVLIEAVPAG